MDRERVDHIDTKSIKVNPDEDSGESSHQKISFHTFVKPAVHYAFDGAKNHKMLQKSL